MPFPLGAQPQRCTHPHIGQNVFTRSPQLQERKGDGQWGPACPKEWASQRLVQGMLGGREAPPHTVSMAQKVREMLHAVFILGYPQVCVAGGGGGHIKGPEKS